MPALKTYSVFICHDWEYCDDYDRVCGFLDAAAYFDWENRSVPWHDPLDSNDELVKNLRDQIRPANVMLVIAGMYSAQSGWMDWEMEFARRIGKPIIGIMPWGSERLPRVVQDNSDEMVGWNTAAIVAAIRRWGR